MHRRAVLVTGGAGYIGSQMIHDLIDAGERVVVSWNVGKFYANFGYWTSNYQSQLYPWKGYGLDGSVGFYEGQWSVDLYLDAYRSSYAYAQQWTDVLASQQLITQKYNDMSGGFRFTERF